jgi:hypothetical protein
MSQFKLPLFDLLNKCRSGPYLALAHQLLRWTMGAEQSLMKLLY